MDVVSTSSFGHAASGQPGLVMDRSSTPETSGACGSRPDAWQTPRESPVVDDEVPPPQALPLGSSVAKGPQQEPAETPPEAQQATDKPKQRHGDQSKELLGDSGAPEAPTPNDGAKKAPALAVHSQEVSITSA